jgi:hypothetical protein
LPPAAQYFTSSDGGKEGLALEKVRPQIPEAMIFPVHAPMGPNAPNELMALSPFIAIGRSLLHDFNPRMISTCDLDLDMLLPLI